MCIKVVKKEEIDEVMNIINDAKKYLSKTSLQWQQGYPFKETMLKDIENNNLFGYYIKDELVSIISLVKGIEKTYVNMIEGKWLIDVSDKDLVIHRIAVKEEYRHQGYAKNLMKYSIIYAKENNLVSIKSDTHKINYEMQNLLLKNGFVYTGIIDLNRGEEDELRLAYELIV